MFLNIKPLKRVVAENNASIVKYKSRMKELSAILSALVTTYKFLNFSFQPKPHM
jgi:hypothetical protein